MRKPNHPCLDRQSIPATGTSHRLAGSFLLLHLHLRCPTCPRPHGRPRPPRPRLRRRHKARLNHTRSDAEPSVPDSRNRGRTAKTATTTRSGSSNNSSRGSSMVCSRSRGVRPPKRGLNMSIGRASPTLVWTGIIRALRWVLEISPGGTGRIGQEGVGTPPTGRVGRPKKRGKMLGRTGPNAATTLRPRRFKMVPPRGNFPRLRTRVWGRQGKIRSMRP
mmetsp:Transcript_21619/g.47049  ORF Transcript_21619/g.47049 Transcript_21619/m.47049 type:complete len:219 (+) Transcript_21619:992-1648(+)